MKASSPTITEEQMAMYRLGLPVAVSEKVVAVLTGRSIKRLQNERLRGVGIHFLKDGKSVRYLLGNVIDEIERNHDRGGR